MLAAGIDVISTVNVQHLESLNDLVFELTGVRVRETFPDRVLDEADQVVLVDLTPEELQLRLQAGKVYPGHQVERALLNFFRLENLAALRELALREVAEDVEARRHPDGPRPDRRAPARRAHPRPRHTAAAVAAAHAPGLALGAAPQRRPRRPLGPAPRPEALRGRSGRRLPTSAASASCSAPTSSRRRATTSSRRCSEVARDRGSTYVFIGTPDSPQSARRSMRGSLVMRLVRALPGIDIRIVADPEKRDKDSARS